MRIYRRGTDNPYRGEFSIDLQNPAIKWNSRTNALEVCAHRVEDFGWGKSNHNYRVVISLPEFAAQLGEIRKAAGANAELSASLTPIVPELLRLALQRTENALTEN